MLGWCKTIKQDIVISDYRYSNIVKSQCKKVRPSFYQDIRKELLDSSSKEFL